MTLSLVIPTYNERENIPRLLALLKEEFEGERIRGEIIVVDDNSPDGTGQIAERLRDSYPDLKVIHRKGKSGLTSAVMAGFASADGDVLGVMDADLSHPVSKLHEMLACVSKEGADIVIGSRYVPGGGIEGWNLYRKALSKGATLLARVFVSTSDPMTGFFLVRREFVEGQQIDAKGFKILLEILVKTKCRNIIEVPITFTNRTAGTSKAGIGEIVYYLWNLIGYIPYKKNVVLEFFKFALVGGIGTLVNLAVLYLLTEYARIYYIFSAVVAFFVAVTCNFILNKLWTFGESLHSDLPKKYSRFVLVGTAALSVNICFLYILTEFFGIHYFLSQVISIGLALMINFIGNKIWTFRHAPRIL